MQFRDVYKLFFRAGEVTEIRALGVSGRQRAWEGWARQVVYGYFDNARDFAAAAAALEGVRPAPKGIYFTPNPVHPDLLARAANRLKAAGAKPKLTGDEDILCLRWLLVDLDPVRKSGISSTDAELRLAMERRNEIGLWIKEQTGLAPGIPACSGNGAHLVVRLDDLENTPETVEQLRRALAGLAEKFSDDQVEVDTSVFNPARIWKLYGTTARKGDSTEARPHRKSYINKQYLEGVTDEK